MQRPSLGVTAWAASSGGSHLRGMNARMSPSGWRSTATAWGCDSDRRLGNGEIKRLKDGANSRCRQNGEAPLRPAAAAHTRATGHPGKIRFGASPERVDASTEAVVDLAFPVGMTSGRTSCRPHVLQSGNRTERGRGPHEGVLPPTEAVHEVTANTHCEMQRRGGQGSAAEDAKLLML